MFASNFSASKLLNWWQHFFSRRSSLSNALTKQLKPIQLILFQINQTGSVPTVASKSETTLETRRSRPIWFWLEVLAVFAIVFAFAGQPTPDVNESHYLTKAKSFWNPDWCAKDLFLQSSDAHFAFFFMFGWLTKFVSLSTFAWIGRIISWLLFSTAWCRLNRTVEIRTGLSVLSALFFVLLIDRFHMAGEWVVGGFEGKSLAYGFTLFALHFFLRSDWPKMVLLLGLAAAFHVVVAAWAAIAIFIATLFLRIANRRAVEFPPRIVTSPKNLFPILRGIALFAMGALPPILNDSVASIEIRSQAAEILVHERLSHHQFFGDFSTMFVGRFAILVVLWFVFARLVRFDLNLAKINLFCFGSLIIAFGGLLLSGIAEESMAAVETIENATQANRAGQWSTKLLTLYWFRLADFGVPLALSLLCMRIFSSWFFKSPFRSQQVATVGFACLIVAAGAISIFEKWQDVRPRADRTALPGYIDAPKRTLETFQNWKKVCAWVKENTPTDANFITPDAQQTFKWYAHRSEVVSWKDVPQDSIGVVQWRERVEKLNLPQRRYLHGLLSYTDQQLLDLATQYDASYLLLPQIAVDLTNEDSKFPSDNRIKQVYPENPEAKSSYVVFKLQVD